MIRPDQHNASRRLRGGRLSREDQENRLKPERTHDIFIDNPIDGAKGRDLWTRADRAPPGGGAPEFGCKVGAQSRQDQVRDDL